MADQIDAGMSDGEAIRFQVKPNAFLYALEASRIYLVIALCMLALLIPYAHLKTGLPVGLAIRISLVGYCVLSLVFFLVVTLGANSMVFIITNKRVIARQSAIGRTIDKISVPIEAIESIEVRSYNKQHGSVYLTRFKALPDRTLRSDISSESFPSSLLGAPRRLSIPIKRRGWASIWFSTPLGSPPLVGFYGLRHFDTFAGLIVVAA